MYRLTLWAALPCVLKEFVSLTSVALSDLTAKPFNPLLGETFEYVDEERGVKFFTEQVSHHPPICAATLESEHFLMEVFHEVWVTMFV